MKFEVSVFRCNDTMYGNSPNTPTVTSRTNVHVSTKLQQVTATLERPLQSINLITVKSFL